MAVRRLRIILAVHRPANLRRGVPPRRVRLLADAIRALGHRVQVITDGPAAVHDVDLMHVFAGCAPDAALKLLRSGDLEHLTTVVSPDFHDPSAERLAQAVPAALDGINAHDAVEARMAALLANSAAYAGSPSQQMERDAPGLPGKLREMCDLADHVVLSSRHERDNLARLGIVAGHHSVIPIGTDPDRYDATTGAVFEGAHGLRGHILNVGSLEPRKNQLLLVQACGALGRPIALIGAGRQSQYAEAVRQRASSDTVFVGQIDEGGMLASAMAGAAALVQPSWAEGAPVTALEAAAIGIPLVLSRRSAEPEYFNGVAEYCDPGSPDSIAAAVGRAIDNDSPGLRRLRRQLVRDKYAWPAVASKVLLAYDQAMLARRRSWRMLARRSRLS